MFLSLRCKMTKKRYMKLVFLYHYENKTKEKNNMMMTPFIHHPDNIAYSLFQKRRNKCDVFFKAELGNVVYS